jgi:excinuclease ABC subunit C
VTDIGSITAALRDRRDGPVEVRIPRRGERRRLLDLAQRNASLAATGLRLSEERVERSGEATLEELRDRLNLERLPERIECYDVSTLGGEATYTSMVVFEHGRPRRDHYRIFAIDRPGQDDYAAIAEAIRRRFTRLAQHDGDASFRRTPDLVVIDGGKGQLRAALEALEESDAPRVAAISLAKRHEEVFLPGRSDSVLLDIDSSALLLLRAVRDEAHRFALRHHRQRRSTSATESILDRIPGIGVARRRALLRHFGSVDAMLQATEAEFEAVRGLPPKVARQVHADLHRIGGPKPMGATAGHANPLPDSS